jgi:hypothetical protein
MSEPIQTPEEGTEKQESVTTETETPEEVAVTTPTEEAEAASTEAATEQASQEPQPQADPYKGKFVASQREAILLNERHKVAEARIESLTKQDTPTDEAMRVLYPEWDNLDEYNKRVLIRQETIAMQNARVQAQQQEIIDRQKLDDELDSVIDANPKLKGKEAEFKRFARNPKNRGISAEVLAKAFLFDASDDEPAPTTPMPKAEGLPAGNGGPREPLKPKKISGEEASNLRKNNYNEWRRLVLAGVIDEDIE